MEIISDGIIVFKDIFLRSEEIIDVAEESPNWRQGTAGKQADPKIRITDVHDLDNSTELHKELLDSIVHGIGKYQEKYPHSNLTKGEHLRVARYGLGGHYALHSDSGGSERVVSCVLYLNSDFEGGELNFPNQDVTIKPEEGMLVLFPSNYLFVHKSLPVTEGKKYCVLSWFK